MKVGDRVNYHSIIGGPVTSIDHTILKIGKLDGGQIVAWISNKPGFVAIEALTPIGHAAEFDIEALRIDNPPRGEKR